MRELNSRGFSRAQNCGLPSPPHRRGPRVPPRLQQKQHVFKLPPRTRPGAGPVLSSRGGALAGGSSPDPSCSGDPRRGPGRGDQPLDRPPGVLQQEAVTLARAPRAAAGTDGRTPQALTPVASCTQTYSSRWRHCLLHGLGEQQGRPGSPPERLPRGRGRTRATGVRWPCSHSPPPARPPARHPHPTDSPRRTRRSAVGIEQLADGHALQLGHIRNHDCGRPEVVDVHGLPQPCRGKAARNRCAPVRSRETPRPGGCHAAAQGTCVLNLNPGAHAEAGPTLHSAP